MRLIIRGSFIYNYLKPAADSLGIDLALLESAQDARGSYAEQVNRLASEAETMGFLYFGNFGAPRAHEEYHNIKVPKIFWSIEDPNHFSSLVAQAAPADIIFTTAQECIRDYRSLYPNKPVDVLTWACEPTYHYPRLDDIYYMNREFDIVFVGNRYPDEFVRVLAEDVILKPAIKWAEKHGKKIGVWGLGDDTRHSWKYYSMVYPKHYQTYTHALEAPKIYRNAIVVLAMNEQNLSPTMTSMRTYEACACGNIVLSHASVATNNIFSNVVLQAEIPEDTYDQLDWVFTPAGINIEAIGMAGRAVNYMYDQHTYRHRLMKILQGLAKID
jgi:spore maturation protein CgeB